MESRATWPEAYGGWAAAGKLTESASAWDMVTAFRRRSGDAMLHRAATGGDAGGGRAARGPWPSRRCASARPEACPPRLRAAHQIGRASGRERVCPYV